MSHSIGQRITRSSGSNLALSFMALPAEKARAMSSFYAFCRIVDDIVDDKQKTDEQKRDDIRFWRDEIARCYDSTPDSELGFELKEIIRHYPIPRQPLYDLMDGVEMDVSKNRYANFEEMSLYCYRVASAVGLVSIEIFGYSNPRSREFAVALGMAFQLTNILRDVRYDFDQYRRIYLPQDELQAFGVSEADLFSQTPHAGRERLLRMQAFRAEHYFQKAARLLPAEDRKNFKAAELMTEIYYRLLNKIRARNYQILGKPVRLHKIEKIIAVSAAKNKGATVFRSKLQPPRKIAVWGAGFAGISAALHLAQQGHHVEIFEAKSYTGGRAHSFTDTHTGLILDNGQHILMGCYRDSLALLELLGVSDKLAKQEGIEVPYLSPGGKRSILKAYDLPAPLHLAAGLFGFNELSWLDRLAILRLGAVIRLTRAPAESLTVADWLRQHGQTSNAIRCLWEPYCIAALNEPVATASALLFHRTVKLSLCGSKQDSSIYLSKVGLSELLSPEAGLFLSSVGSKLHTGLGVRSVNFEDGSVTGFVTSAGDTVTADCYVSALPWTTLRSLLPEKSTLSQDLRNIGSAPIISLHLISDCAIVKESYAGLLDSPVQWIFNRGTASIDGQSGHLSAIIISAAYDLLDVNGPELLEKVWSEINRYFPSTCKGKVLHHVVYKSRDATFAARPGVNPFRSGPKSHWKNLYLAGDWTETGLPATLEGAVQSGRLAAEAMD